MLVSWNIFRRAADALDSPKCTIEALELSILAYLERCANGSSADLASQIHTYSRFASEYVLPLMRDRAKFRRGETALLIGVLTNGLESENAIFCVQGEVKSLIERGALGSDFAELVLPLLYCVALAQACDFLIEPPVALGGNLIGRIRGLLRVVSQVVNVDEDSFEANLCPFEHYLLEDPAGIYAEMALESKRAYRAKVYELAGRRDVPSQMAVASVALCLSKDASAERVNDSRCHIGYQLWNRDNLSGRPKSGLISQSPSGDERFLGRYSFIMSLLLATFIIPTCILVEPLWQTPYIWSPLLFILYQSLTPAAEFLFARVFGERHLLRLDFIKAGIPSGCRVIIAVPTVLATIDQARKVLGVAERNLMTSNDTNITVAILTDYADASHRDANPQELDLIDFFISEIKRLNTKHNRLGRQPFALLHRDRVYSPSERCWMGRERKRGKIEDFNAFVVGHGDIFSRKVAVRDLPGAKYVMLLDDDCLLARDAVQMMVGVLEHPFSRPVMDDRGAVVSGHALVVPNTATSISSVSGWRWSFLLTGPQKDVLAIHRPTGNFLFDATGRSHYPGKGLYNVAAFHGACAGKMPNSLILSHDTVEAAWVRPAYLGAAAIVEGFPSSMRALTNRNHRWMRGNVQNLWYGINCGSRGRLPTAFWFVLWHQLITDAAPALITVVMLTGMTLNTQMFSSIGSMVAVFSVASPIVVVVRDIVKIGTRRNSPRLVAITSGRSVVQLLLFLIYRIASSAQLGLLFVDALIRSVWRLFRGQHLLDWIPCASAHAIPRRTILDFLGVISSASAGVLIFAFSMSGYLNAGAGLVLAGWLFYPLASKFFDAGSSRA